MTLSGFGIAANSRCCSSVIAVSLRGRIHAGVRWYTTRCSVALGDGRTTWIALAPVPITATRVGQSDRGRGSTRGMEDRSGELAEPGDVGCRRSMEQPMADTSTFASYSVP